MELTPQKVFFFSFGQNLVCRTFISAMSNNCQWQIPLIFLEKRAQEEVKSKVKVRSSAQSLNWLMSLC